MLFRKIHHTLESGIWSSVSMVRGSKLPNFSELHSATSKDKFTVHGMIFLTCYFHGMRISSAVPPCGETGYFCSGNLPLWVLLFRRLPTVSRCGVAARLARCVVNRSAMFKSPFSCRGANIYHATSHTTQPCCKEINWSNIRHRYILGMIPGFPRAYNCFKHLIGLRECASPSLGETRSGST